MPRKGLSGGCVGGRDWREAQKVAPGDARSRPRKGGDRRRRRPIRGLTRNHARADAEACPICRAPRGRASVEPFTDRRSTAGGDGSMRFLALIGALAIIAAIGAAIYFFGGFYNVAETRTIRRSSTGRWRARGERPSSRMEPRRHRPISTIPRRLRPALASSTIGCVNCHGGPPDANWAKWSEGLKPVPADLKVDGERADRRRNCSGRSRTASSSPACRALAWPGRPIRTCGRSGPSSRNRRPYPTTSTRPGRAPLRRRD